MRTYYVVLLQGQVKWAGHEKYRAEAKLKEIPGSNLERVRAYNSAEAREKFETLASKNV